MKIADFLVHLSLCPSPVWARLSPVLSAPALWVKVGDVPSRAEGAPRVPALSLLAPRGCTEPRGRTRLLTALFFPQGGEKVSPLQVMMPRAAGGRGPKCQPPRFLQMKQTYWRGMFFVKHQVHPHAVHSHPCHHRCYSLTRN